jgi:hypothetical protein
MLDGRAEERELRDAMRMGELEATSWLELSETVGGQADVDATSSADLDKRHSRLPDRLAFVSQM